MEQEQRADSDEDLANTGTPAQRTTSRDSVRSASSENGQKMSDVAELTSRVTNVSLEEVSAQDTPDAAQAVSNISSPLPQREVRSRPHRTKSATSFVSCPSTPCDSGTTVPKSVRPITTFFTPISKTPKPTSVGRDHGSNTTSNTIVTPKPRPVTPNILEGLIPEEDTTVPKPVMTSSQTTSDEILRGAKRKRIASGAANNYEVANNTPNDQQQPIQPLEMDDLSKLLFEESGRPAITITSRVSDNRSNDSNALSVSFQIPAQNPDPGAAASDTTVKPTPTDVGKAPVDPGTPWMSQIEQDYYNTTRSSVVAEVRAKHRSQMLADLTNNGIVAPWALFVAPMPVYLHPHATKIAGMMKQQALDFQLKIADMLHEEATFQTAKITVDRTSLSTIFGDNQEGYRLSVGALFDARLKVQMSIKEQLTKYKQNLAQPENQATDKELASMVRGIIPKKYGYNNAVELPNQMEPPQTVDRQNEARPQQERSRGRSRSRSRRRGRSSSRPAKRGNFNQDRDYGFGNGPPQQPQHQHTNQNYPPRGQAPGGYPWGGQGARPKQYQQQQQQPRGDTGALDPNLFTPDLIRKIAEAYDGLHK